MFRLARFAMPLVGLAASPSLAQETAAEGADDAFGRRVGIEAIGLYSEGQVRGFNLENAGNYRIEGHYFARSSSPQYLVRSSTVTRIGLNALRYDFPAPSGIAEINLRTAPEGIRASLEGGTRAYSGPFADITGSFGSKGGRLQLTGGINLAPNQEYTNGAGGDYYGGGALLRWQPSDAVKLGLFGTASDWVAEPDTGVAVNGEYLPPKLKRGVLRVQDWSRFDSRQQNVGLFGDAEAGGGWTVGGGLFHSASQANRTDFHLLEVTNPDGSYRSAIFVAPRRTSAAQSGSVVVSKSWSSGSLRHRVVGTVRARRTENGTAPSLTFDTGVGRLDGPYPLIPEPDFSIPDGKVHDLITQRTAGLGYRVTIADAVELRGDVQKTDYRRRRTALNGTATSGRDRPWLYSGSASWLASDDLTLFASYSRGLEESGVAPNSAINRGEVLPAVIATQRELGARYALTDKLSLIAGLFDTRKATPGTGPDGRFGLIGEVRHRGFEGSIAGSLSPRLDVLAGLMLLQAEVRGDLVDAGAIGRKAVGRPNRVGLLNVTWRPAQVGNLSLDATLNHEGPRYISAANQVRSKPFNTLDFGARYAFKVGDLPLTLRGRVLNVFNDFTWVPDVSGTFFHNEQRGYHLSLRADF